MVKGNWSKRNQGANLFPGKGSLFLYGVLVPSSGTMAMLANVIEHFMCFLAN